MFAEIDDRREQVQRAHRETFRWIFQSDHETGFAAWLSSGDGIFWIHGKPASGKSTLMKYITQEKRLEELLDVWTGSSPLVVASFYFWVAGSPLQRSLVGLYRTLLHQMLKKEEHMCRIAFPDWQRKFENTEPTLGMLTAAVNRILTSGRLSHNFFFIIDGLDEYDMDSIGKTQLAELMLELTRSPRVKLLLSSRPETPFKTAFQQCPTLRLEKLTESDISAYVDKRLWSNHAVRNVSDVQAESIKGIESFILNNAQGVFLWVVLTLSIALDGISNHEDLAVVRDRVTHLPPELDEMFTHILTKRIPQHHQQEAFRCLFITLVWNSESSRQSSWMDLPHMVVSVACQASSYADACAIANAPTLASAQHSRNRLASRCQGLLETSAEANTHTEVKFLHRTLFDYLREDQVAHNLLQAGLGDTFDVYTAIMAGVICTSRFQPRGRRTMGLIFFHFNMLAEHSTRQSRSALVNIFGQAAGNAGLLRVTNFQRHRSSDFFETQQPTESSLLIWAVYCGAALYFQESIENDEVPDVRASSQLLYYALMRLFSKEDMHDDRPVEPNLAISATLLDHGADPAYDIGEMCPWTLVLHFVVNTGTVRQFHYMRAALRTLVMFARSAPDLQKCSALQVSPFVEDFDASKAMRRCILERNCCKGQPVRSCQCHRGQSLKSLAMELLDFVEAKRQVVAQTGNTQNKRTKTSRFRKWSVKKWLSQRI